MGGTKCQILLRRSAENLESMAVFLLGSAKAVLRLWGSSQVAMLP
jgi:hypothetical protein